MKEISEYDRATVYLDKISDAIRKELFDDGLEKPIITLQTTRGAYGHFEIVPKWINEKGTARYEININGEYITRPIEDVIGTIIHEYVHYYCLINNIKDTSRGGTYHNKRFKEEAEKRMLKIDYDERIGYSITSPTPELLDWVIGHGFTDIKIGRNPTFMGIMVGVPTSKGKPENGNDKHVKSSSRKYQCPKCKLSIRATKNLTDRLKCIQCDEVLQEI